MDTQPLQRDDRGRSVRAALAATVVTAVITATAYWIWQLGTVFTPVAAQMVSLMQEDRKNGSSLEDMTARWSGLAFPPLMKHTIRDYPPIALRHRQSGTVVLKLQIAPDGQVDDASVEKSSGYPQLDAAALVQVGNWLYLPARKGGVPVASTNRVSIVFRLIDDAPAARPGQHGPFL